MKMVSPIFVFGSGPAMFNVFDGPESVPRSFVTLSDEFPYASAVVVIEE